MISPLPKILILLILIAAFLTGCTNSQPSNVNSSNSNSNGNSANTAEQTKDNVEELESVINLPVIPEEATWRDETLDAEAAAQIARSAGTRKLTAVLRYAPENSGKVAEMLQATKTGEPASLNTESWFPAELVAQSQTSGNETVKGLSYPAGEFLRQPFTDGRITRVEGTDYFILEFFGR